MLVTGRGEPRLLHPPEVLQRKQNMPIAVTIGAHPSSTWEPQFCGIDTDEYEIMGGSRRPRVVKCTSVDLEVPPREICWRGISTARSANRGPSASGTPSMETDEQPRRDDHAMTMRANHLPHSAPARDHSSGGSPGSADLQPVKVAARGPGRLHAPRAAAAPATSRSEVRRGERPRAARCSRGPFVRHAVFVDEDVNIFDDAEVLRAVT